MLALLREKAKARARRFTLLACITREARFAPPLASLPRSLRSPARFAPPLASLPRAQMLDTTADSLDHMHDEDLMHDEVPGSYHEPGDEELRSMSSLFLSGKQQTDGGRRRRRLRKRRFLDLFHAWGLVLSGWTTPTEAATNDLGAKLIPAMLLASEASVMHGGTPTTPNWLFEDHLKIIHRALRLASLPRSLRSFFALASSLPRGLARSLSLPHSSKMWGLVLKLPC